jgi:recombination protein RecT
MNNAVEPVKHPLVVLKERLDARTDVLRATLGNIDPERFKHAVILSARINPAIAACDFGSVWLACMRACRDGLLPDGVQGAIVPYRDQAQWIPMVRGLLDRIWKSGLFLEVHADVVRQGEPFEYFLTQNGPQFRHVPGESDGPITKAYATARSKDGGFFVAVLPLSEINKIKKMSKTTREDAPWKMWESEMMKKTAVRRLSKLLPGNIEMPPEDDDENEQPPEPTAAPKASRPSDPAAVLAAFAGTSPATETPSGAGDGGGREAVTLEATGSRVAESVAELHAVDPASIEATSKAEQDKRDAYQRGLDAKAKGTRSSACPGEYRGTPLADHWLAGWHGERFVDARETAEQRDLDLKG